ncbi:glycine zipper 2TM domain-containing protein [Hymenobacter wooponensis]|uniref:Glycine zipper 2TM domain-containing protein n=1 Tax=Hymenobacter wooponensis TaxID=1525360 RepID=A0A4Z0MUZ6_9BACT|nr:glycine zipper 2TM domain-containing protein [Hymenobacter wooponensis]TGD83138.1 glycine zipper 2TM domain-containing protein [Hymenobacter wooponensis]
MKKVSVIFAFVILFTTIFSGYAQAQNRISSSAKGAVIGGIGGAAAGALINKKNRVVGGAVGGVAGGGLGYAIGRNADNKRRAEAARVAAARRAEQQRAAAYRKGLAQGAARSKANTALAAAPVTAAPAAAAPAMMNSFASPGAPSTFAVNSAYLPNSAFGQRDAAYPSSEVRRKSW